MCLSLVENEVAYLKTLLINEWGGKAYSLFYRVCDELLRQKDEDASYVHT